jgi:hypothetical protein
MSYSLLCDVSNPTSKLMRHETNLIAYPFDWQEPAATERAAYESILNISHSIDFEYVAFPWATLIDNLRISTPLAIELLGVLSKMASFASHKTKRVTVAQHINVIDFIDVFKSVGITDIFWSHKTQSMDNYNGVRLHAFPLYPAQAADLVDFHASIDVERKYLTNFIGAYNPNLYISNVREVIFQDEGKYTDVFIIKRDAWHFDRKVYKEQVGGVKSNVLELSKEEVDKNEYIRAIKESWFTLCPTGAGPNSIRLFESLSLGSIPILLTKDLSLPDDQELWFSACIIEDDSAEGYRNSIRKARDMSIDDRLNMVRAGRVLSRKVFPLSYANIIMYSIENGINKKDL